MLNQVLDVWWWLEGAIVENRLRFIYFQLTQVNAEWSIFMSFKMKNRNQQFVCVKSTIVVVENEKEKKEGQQQ